MRDNRPTLNEMKNWPLDRVEAQRDREREEHRANLDNPSYARGHQSLSALYRLGYMRWLLNGQPQPMPTFV